MAFSSLPQNGDDDDLNALHEINVTPFIDVMLVLLIIFMVAAPLSTANVPIDLPSTTKAPQQADKEPLMVSLKTSGDLYLGDDDVPRDQFTAKLGAVTKGDKETRIFLRADKNVDYAALMNVMDLLRDGGYTKVALVGLESPVGESKP